MKKSEYTRPLKGVTESKLSKEELWDDFELFAKNMLHIIDFNQKGGVVLMDFWPSQASLYKHILKIEALNLYRGMKTLPAGEKGPAMAVLGYDTHHASPPHTTAMRKIVEYGPRKLLRKLHGMGYKHLTCDPVRAIFGKARREGVTVQLLGMDYQLATLKGHTEVAIVAHNEKAVQNIFRTASRFHKLCPPEFHHVRPQESAGSRTQLDFHNGAKLGTYTAHGADVRSFQFDIVHLSEYAHYEDMSAVASLLAAVPPHCWVFKESTAAGAQGPFYEDWKRAHTPEDVAAAWDREDNDFFAKWNGLYKWFFSWMDDPRYQMQVFNWEKEHLLSTMDDYEKALQDRFGKKKFSLERMKWRRNKIKSGECDDATLTPEQFFAQEYPADEDEMFQTTGDQPFPLDKINAMDQRAKANPPKLRLLIKANEMPRVVHHMNSNMLVWEPPAEGQEYVIGCDVSQGLGKRGDASYAAVFLRLDGVARRQVASFWSKTMPAKEVAHVLTTIAEWYNDAFVVPESLGPGQLVCATMYEDNRYPFIYKRENLGHVSFSSSEVNSFYLGYYTGAEPKKSLIGELIWAVRNDLIEIRDPLALQELKIYRRNDKGQYCAPEGENDDRVIGVALGNFGDSVQRGARALQHTGHERRRPNRFLQAIPETTPTHDPYTRELLGAVARMRDKATKQKAAGSKSWWNT